MADALTTVQTAYAAFGRGDVPTILGLVTDDVRWQFIGDRKAPYTGTLNSRSQVGEWFGAVAQADDIQVFEPRQFLVGPDHVTVLGWERTVTKPGGKAFESEWVHIFRFRDGRVSSFLGIYDTEAAAAAR